MGQWTHRALAGLAALLVTACGETDPMAMADAELGPPGGGPIAGGWAPTEVIGDTQIACNIALEEVYARVPTGEAVERITAEVQVVAGLNHRCRLLFPAEGGLKTLYTVTVYQDLEGGFQVTSFDAVPKAG